jgi:spermidine synthase
MKSDFKWIKKKGEKMPTGNWFIEFFNRGEFHCHQIKKIIATSKTEFQYASLIETSTFKKVLIIDGETQSSEYDEFIYHEALVWPSMLMSKKAEKALILGGGEGATAREILCSKKIKKLIMVDIDHNILKFAKKYLYSWHRNSFYDERFTLLVQDAKKYVENTKLKFDLIYSDLPSPIEGGPAYQLYTVEFYRQLKKIMSENGIFAMQSGPGTPLQFEMHPFIFKTLSKVFKYVSSYSFFIPSYDMPWTFLTASDMDLRTQIKKMDFKKKIKSDFVKSPRLFDSENIVSLFNSIPLYLKKDIAKCKNIISKDRPLFFTTSR